MKQTELHTFQTAFDLVCQCARGTLNDSRLDRIRDATERGVSWNHVNALASAHQVTPLLFKSLAAACPDTLPEELRAFMASYTKGMAIRNLFLVRELGRLVVSLRDHNIQALAYKGPVLAKWAYGDINFRSYNDIDVWVPSHAFKAVERLLLDDGYAPRKDLSGWMGVRQKLYLWQMGQSGYQRGASVFYVDLHTAVMPRRYLYDRDFSDCWARAEQVTLADYTVPTFQAEDMLHILCYHGANNRWGLLKQVCDIAELIGGDRVFDWDMVLARARQTRGERILYVGLALAQRLLDAALPHEVAQRLEQDRVVNRLTNALIERLMRPSAHSGMFFGERFRFNLEIQDTLATKLRYCHFAFLRRLSAIGSVR